MDPYDKAKWIKRGLTLGAFLLAVLLPAIASSFTKNMHINDALWFFIVPFMVFMFAFFALFEDWFGVENFILRRLMKTSPSNEGETNKELTPKTDSERLQNLEKSVKELHEKFEIANRKASASKIVAIFASVFAIAMCIYFVCFRS